jgi:hypothetical protein
LSSGDPDDEVSLIRNDLDKAIAARTELTSKLYKLEELFGEAKQANLKATEELQNAISHEAEAASALKSSEEEWRSTDRAGYDR